MALTMKERLDEMIQSLEPEVGSLVEFVIKQEKDNLSEKYPQIKKEIRKRIDETVAKQLKESD